MNFTSPGPADEGDEPASRRASNDRVVDHHDALSVQNFANGVVLDLHFCVASRLRRLDEGSSDVVVANQCQFVRQTAYLSETKRRRVRRVGYAEHEIRARGRELAGELAAKRSTRPID